MFYLNPLQGLCYLSMFYNVFIAQALSIFLLYIEEFLKVIRLSKDEIYDKPQLYRLIHHIIVLIKMCRKYVSVVLLSLIAVNFFASLRIFYGVFLIAIGEISAEVHFTISACFWSVFQFYFIASYLKSINTIEQEFRRIMFDREHEGTSKNDLRIFFIQQDVTFTAGNLFNVDNSLMTMFVSSIVSYFIVVIQFHLQV